MRKPDKLPDIDTIFKYDGEKFYIKVDYSSVLRDGDSLVLGSSSVSAYEFSGENVTAQIISLGSTSVVGNVLQAQVQSGNIGNQYKIVFSGGTANGDIFEYWIKLVIIDFPR